MPGMPDESKISAQPRKRILTLDGGGVRGVFTIEVLARMETLLRENLGRPNLVLADHFHLMAGTSTGAIIATLLSWGESVEQVRKLYNDHCHEIFPPFAPWKVWRFRALLRRMPRAWFSEEPLITFFKGQFKDTKTGKDALLGSSDLKTYLLLCMRNSSKGSAWPLTNNPKAHYNQPTEHSPNWTNLDIPLWQLVRASTAAPIFFLPELIDIGKYHFAFIDGGLTPYNNPALIAYLTATQPCYQFNWPTGVDKLHVVSVGTLRIRSIIKDLSFRSINFISDLIHASSDLMESSSMQQDYLCRLIGSCLHGDEVDREVGDLIPADGKPDPSKQFSYVRYNHEFAGKELDDAAKKYGQMILSNTRTMPFITQLGFDFAQKNVKIEHLV